MPLVVFDLGGVLVRIRHGLEACAQAAGVPFDSQWLTPERARLLNEWMDTYQAGKVDLDTLAGKLSVGFGGVLTREDFVTLHNHILVGAYAGAEGLVREVQAAGVSVAILSNTCAIHWEELQDYGAIQVVAEELRYLSFELGYAKPSDVIFECVERLSGREACDIVFLDDSEMHVAAAQARGWKAALISAEREGMREVADTLEKLGVFQRETKG